VKEVTVPIMNQVDSYRRMKMCAGLGTLEEVALAERSSANEAVKPA